MYLAYYLGFAVLGVLAFALGWRVAGAGKRPALAGYGVVLTLLVTKAILNHNPVWEFALFGTWPDYVFIQSYLIFPLGLCCLGLAAGLLPPGPGLCLKTPSGFDRLRLRLASRRLLAVRPLNTAASAPLRETCPRAVSVRRWTSQTEPNRRAVTVLAGFLVLVSLWTERWIFVEPDDSSTTRADADHHCTQSTGFSCGPAACVSLLSHLGVDATEGEMMRLCRTPNYGGTSLFRMCRGLRLKLGDGYDVRIIDGDPERLRARGGPAIVSRLRMHAVTVRFTNEGVIVLDPGKPGPKQLTIEEFADRYGGPAVIVDEAAQNES